MSQIKVCIVLGQDKARAFAWAFMHRDALGFQTKCPKVTMEKHLVHWENHVISMFKKTPVIVRATYNAAVPVSYFTLKDYDSGYTRKGELPALCREVAKILLR